MALGENISVPRTGQNAMRFMGRDASLEFPNLMIWKHAAEPHDWTQPMVSEPIPLRAEDAYITQMRHFMAVIRGEEKPRIDAADATRSVAATVAVFESARTGKRVSVVPQQGRM